MSIIFKIIFFILLLGSTSYSEELNKIGTFKDWDAIVVTNGDSKVCFAQSKPCLLYTSPSPRDSGQSRMPSSA